MTPYQTLHRSPLRSEAEARARIELRRDLAILRNLADRLERGAQGNIHASVNPARNKFGHQQSGEAHAIRRRLLHLDPVTELPRQFLDDLSKAGN